MNLTSLHYLLIPVFIGAIMAGAIVMYKEEEGEPNLEATNALDESQENQVRKPVEAETKTSGGAKNRRKSTKKRKCGPRKRMKSTKKNRLKFI